MKIALIAAAAGLMATAATGAQATVLASNIGGSSSSAPEGAPAQSFTVVGTGTYRNISFAFHNIRGSNVGQGNLYLFDKLYAGTPSGLADADALGAAAYADGVFAFAPKLELVAGSVYYAYADTPFSVGFTRENAYAGGGAYLAYAGGNNPANTSITTREKLDFHFTVSSVAPVVEGGPGSGGPTPGTDPVAGAVPEPATWAMMILGFGVVGGSMRRRAKVAVRFA